MNSEVFGNAMNRVGVVALTGFFLVTAMVLFDLQFQLGPVLFEIALLVLTLYGWQRYRRSRLQAAKRAVVIDFNPIIWFRANDVEPKVAATKPQALVTFVDCKTNRIEFSAAPIATGKTASIGSEPSCGHNNHKETINFAHRPTR